MREFGDWIKDQAGTIEDKSTFIKPSQTSNGLPVLSKIQKRLMFADMLVPAVKNSPDVLRWIEAFTCVVGEDPPYYLETIELKRLVGKSLEDELDNTKGPTDEVLWVAKVRDLILRGKL